MKDIKSALRKIETEEKIITKIAKFLTTKRGKKFVSELNMHPLCDLCRKYNAPKFVRLYKNDTKNKNIIIGVIKKYKIAIPEYKPIEIKPPVRTKHPVRLTKKELSEMYARHSRKQMGFAALMHAYEEYSMSKFIAKHPAPTEQELAEDLFPEELKAGYNNMLYIHREYVRNLLCKKYAKTTPKETFFRIFTVLSITEDPATGKKHKPIVSEVEATDCYAFTHLNKNSDKTSISKKIKQQAKIAYQADNHAIKVKLYDKYGNLIDECNCK